MRGAAGRDRGESPQAIFDRIRQRRAAPRAAAAAPAAGSRALRIDELVDAGPESAGPTPCREDAMADTFARSATVRTLLRHPALAVGVGVPAAVLLLRTSAARRLLQTGLVLGARPEIRALLGAALAAATNAMEDRRRRGAVDGGAGTDGGTGRAGEVDSVDAARTGSPRR